MIIDVHCHYSFTGRRRPDIDRFSFEPLGPADFDSCVAPRIVGQLKWRALRWLLGVSPTLPAGDALDAEMDRVYERHLGSPGPVDRFVLLAFDAYHDDAGRRPMWPTKARELGSDIYTSNSLVRAACRSRPDRYLFGASVHPYRQRATDCVREVFAAGACLLKWLPLHQNIDIEDERSIAVLRVLAELGLPLLVHYNEEFTLTTQHPQFLDIEPLLRVLRRLRAEGAMPPTIVAHVATPVSPWGNKRPMRALLHALSGEFSDAPLFGDVSALTTLGKVGFLRKIVARQDLHHKLLFGSDFPVPLGLLRLRGDLRSDYRLVARDPSWPQQAAHIYRRTGLQEISFRRAASLLPNLSHFA